MSYLNISFEYRYYQEVVTHFETHSTYTERPLAPVVFSFQLFKKHFPGNPPWRQLLVRSFWRGGTWHDGWFCQTDNNNTIRRGGTT